MQTTGACSESSRLRRVYSTIHLNPIERSAFSFTGRRIHAGGSSGNSVERRSRILRGTKRVFSPLFGERGFPGVVIIAGKRTKASLHRRLHYVRHMKRPERAQWAASRPVSVWSASSPSFSANSLLSNIEKASLKGRGGRVHSSIAQLASPRAPLFPHFPAAYVLVRFSPAATRRACIHRGYTPRVNCRLTLARRAGPTVSNLPTG